MFGSADWHQTAFNDHSCYTVDGRILIDACPSVVTQLLEQGVDPLAVPVVCMIHMHCNHYMGLAPLLHYWRVCRNTDLSGLTIVGPKTTVRRGVQRALAFVFQEELPDCVTRMPEIVELEGDCEISALGYRIRVTDSDHAVPGLCYRIADGETGRSVGLTGDTRYRAGIFVELSYVISVPRTLRPGFELPTDSERRKPAAAPATQPPLKAAHP